MQQNDPILATFDTTQSPHGRINAPSLLQLSMRHCVLLMLVRQLVPLEFLSKCSFVCSPATSALFAPAAASAVLFTGVGLLLGQLQHFAACAYTALVAVLQLVPLGRLLLGQVYHCLLLLLLLLL
jgi:hypothetical protein